MPTQTKKPCLNNQKFLFTGKESSPLGLGYSATPENVGTKKVGKDGTEWIVGMRNGVRVWVRSPTELVKEKPVINKKKSENKSSESESEEEPIIAAKPTKAAAKAAKPAKAAPAQVIDSSSESGDSDSDSGDSDSDSDDE